MEKSLGRREGLDGKYFTGLHALTSAKTRAISQNRAGPNPRWPYREAMHLSCCSNFQSC
jgi:hypothetical protein